MVRDWSVVYDALQNVGSRIGHVTRGVRGIRIPLVKIPRVPRSCSACSACSASFKSNYFKFLLVELSSKLSSLSSSAEIKNKTQGECASRVLPVLPARCSAVICTNGSPCRILAGRRGHVVTSDTRVAPLAESWPDSINHKGPGPSRSPCIRPVFAPSPVSNDHGRPTFCPRCFLRPLAVLSVFLKLLPRSTS